MKRALWVLAVLVDGFGIAATWPLFTAEPSASSVAWGVVVIAVLVGLLVLLLRPQVFGRLALVSAKVLCTALPVIAFLGSLDSASISGQEVVAIAIAALAAWLNWVALRGHAVHAAPRAA
jgi:hypothetical protein